MYLKELFSRIKLIGVKSGVIEIEFSETNIIIGFYDEDTGITANLYSIQLGEYSFIKESYEIGKCDLSRIKDSEEAKVARKLLMDKGNRKKSELITKANELAEEITNRAGIPVKVIPRLQGTPFVATEFDNNMWIASQVLQGIDDDY